MFTTLLGETSSILEPELLVFFKLFSVEVTPVSVGEASGVVRLTVFAAEEVETHEAAGSVGIAVIQGVECEAVVVASLVGIAGAEVFTTAPPSLKSPVGIF